MGASKGGSKSVIAKTTLYYDNLSTHLDDYLKCKYYCPTPNKLGGDVCKFSMHINASGYAFSKAICDNGDITTCIYKNDQKIQEIVKEKKDELMRAEEQIRKLLIKIAGLEPPYR